MLFVSNINIFFIKNNVEVTFTGIHIKITFNIVIVDNTIAAAGLF